MVKVEYHLQAFEERKETIVKWAVEVRGIENSQRIIGDNASKAICELLSAFLLKKKIVELGFQLNNSWLKSDSVFQKLPEFENKKTVLEKMFSLELTCEKLSYGAPKPKELIELVLSLFFELEKMIKGLLE